METAKCQKGQGPLLNRPRLGQWLDKCSDLKRKLFETSAFVSSSLSVVSILLHGFLISSPFQSFQRSQVIREGELTNLNTKKRPLTDVLTDAVSVRFSGYLELYPFCLFWITAQWREMMYLHLFLKHQNVPKTHTRKLNFTPEIQAICHEFCQQNFPELGIVQ